MQAEFAADFVTITELQEEEQSDDCMDRGADESLLSGWFGKKLRAGSEELEKG